jgi:hypothetical protein
VPRYSGQVHASRHQYYLTDSEQSPYPPYRGPSNGLVYVAEGGGIQLLTGANTGRIALTVDLLDGAPPVAYDEWDEIVEVNYASGTGDARILSFPARPVRDIPPVTHAGPGDYRIRVHARHRDDPRNRLAATVAEQHHFAVWPASDRQPAPTILHKLTDDFGRQWRAAGR